MKRLSKAELKGLAPLDADVDALEEVKRVTFTELNVAVFYDEGTDLFVVDVYEIDEVTARYTGCTGIEALQMVMDILERAFNG